MLHIGCGATLLISQDVDEGFKVLVVDTDLEAIDMQKGLDEGYRESQNPLPKYLKMDASDIKPDSKDFPSNGFDKIVILNVFEVFVGSGEEKVITAILELIKEGGEVYATTRNDTGYSPETEAEMLLRIAESKGIIIEKVSDDMKPSEFMGGTFAIFKVIGKNSIGNKIPKNINKRYVNITI